MIPELDTGILSFDEGVAGFVLGKWRETEMYCWVSLKITRKSTNYTVRFASSRIREDASSKYIKTIRAWKHTNSSTL